MYFEMSRQHDITSLSLFNIRQEQGESLRAYIDRFKTTALKVKNLNFDNTLWLTIASKVIPWQIVHEPSCQYEWIKIASHQVHAGGAYEKVQG